MGDFQYFLRTGAFPTALAKIAGARDTFARIAQRAPASTTFATLGPPWAEMRRYPVIPNARSPADSGCSLRDPCRSAIRNRDIQSAIRNFRLTSIPLKNSDFCVDHSSEDRL
jgi:hypothetical protein